VHVTLRSAFRPLRSRFLLPTVLGTLEHVNRRSSGFRVVHFSIQFDHAHLLVEATDKRALSSGLRSLSICMALRINGLLGRRGRLWADRWHGRELASPREVRVALAYVLHNFRKHRRSASAHLDAFSSAPYFDGFREFRGVPPGPPTGMGIQHARAIAHARTWLLSKGWRRYGLLSATHE
jgi:hypothetical protein